MIRYTSYKETFNKGQHEYHFTTIACPECKGTAEITVKGSDLFQYNQGAFIQNAFPYLSTADRERLMSGYCGPCFDSVFAKEEP